MDLRLRELENHYKSGDITAGAQLLSAMVRSGVVESHKAELAAIYQHPIAMLVFGESPAPYGKRDEERILPLELGSFDNIAPWTCEVYIRRLLALAKWSSFSLEVELELAASSLQTAIFELVRDHLNGIPFVEEERLRLSQAATLAADAHHYNLHDGMIAQYYSWLAMGALARSIDCDNLHGIISDAGPAWACASMAALESHLGQRDPNLPENVRQGFGPRVIEAAYDVLLKDLTPWLLDPFPS